MTCPLTLTLTCLEAARLDDADLDPPGQKFTVERVHEQHHSRFGSPIGPQAWIWHVSWGWILGGEGTQPGLVTPTSLPTEGLLFRCSVGMHSPAGLPRVTIRPLERRKSGKRPLVSCNVPKKFTSMQLRNVANGASSASATTSLKPALLTRPHKPEGMEQGGK